MIDYVKMDNIDRVEELDCILVKNEFDEGSVCLRKNHFQQSVFGFSNIMIMENYYINGKHSLFDQKKNEKHLLWTENKKI